MTRTSIETKIKEIISQFCMEPSDVDDISVTDSLQNADCDTAFDDLDMIEMIMTIEEEFDIEIAEGRHNLEDETNWSIQNMVDYIAFEMGVV